MPAGINAWVATEVATVLRASQHGCLAPAPRASDRGRMLTVSVASSPVTGEPLLTLSEVRSLVGMRLPASFDRAPDVLAGGLEFDQDAGVVGGPDAVHGLVADETD